MTTERHNNKVVNKKNESDFVISLRRYLVKIKGFSLIEMIIAVSVFLLISGLGVGSYVQYYKTSIYQSDLQNAIDILKYTRSQALKSTGGVNYGLHIDNTMQTMTTFKDTYISGNPENKVMTLDRLEIDNLSLQPDLGITDEIIFESKTGKTQNSGTFELIKDEFSHQISINSQGLIN